MKRDNLSKPNFFIIGAPKCGTSAMANFLGLHQQIFISHPKEINFFNTDLKIGDIKSLDKYLSIFKKTRKEHLAIGEASTLYLYSAVAIDNILQFNPNAKFIIMLRNPIEMVTSYHAEMLWSGLENIESFEKAWYSRNNGCDDFNVGYACKDISLLRYNSVCKLGLQVDRLLKKVDRKNIYFSIYDDILANHKAECKKILNFLGVESETNFELNKINISKKYKSRFFRQLVWLLGRTRQYIKLPHSTEKIINLIHQVNSMTNDHQNISYELKLELINAFQDDIVKLETNLGRNFSHWLEA